MTDEPRTAATGTHASEPDAPRAAAPETTAIPIPEEAEKVLAAAALEVTATVAKEAMRVSNRNLLTWFLMGLLATGLYFAYILLLPFINTLVFAVVFAALFHPAYAYLLKKLNGRESVSSLIVLFGVIVLVILPLVLLIVGLIPQMRYSVTSITIWLGEGHLDEVFTHYLAPFFDWIQREAPFLDLSAESAKIGIITSARQAGQKLLGLSADVVGGTVTFALHFGLFLVALFFFLKDGGAMIERIKYLTPLREDQQERILRNMRRISQSVLVGGFLVAALQGLVGGIGLAFVGMPALFWGTVMTFAAFVPVVGTGLIWVPAAAFLFFIGSWKSALFLTLWCGILVASIDTVLRPFLMRDAAGVPILFLFLAILGGLRAFGIFGLLYGPLILTFAVVMLKIYADEYAEQLKSKGAWGPHGS